MSCSSTSGFVVTGGHDTVINVFSLDSPKKDPDFSLVGHTENVCTLATTLGGTIISGSWDRWDLLTERQFIDTLRAGQLKYGKTFSLHTS